MSEPTAEGAVTMPNGTKRDVAYRDCPCCGQRNEGEPYDIGSGPELSCSSCETCWGAEGQNLNPYDAFAGIAADPELRKQMGWDDENGKPKLMLAFTACLECGKPIASKWTPEKGTSPVENCGSHQ